MSVKEGDRLTTGDVARLMRARGYLVSEGPSRIITGGAADSRRVAPGDVFAAFRGERVDGNDFIDQAVAAGAVAVLCERRPAALDGVTVVTVSDTRLAAKELGRAWRDACRATVVGITGTVGKTTAKEAVAATLATRHRVHRSPGNMNSREGLPLALLSLRRSDDFAVLEMAMDSPGEILELCEVARPAIGVVLNIGLTHVSKLGSLEAIAREKLSLVRWLDASGVAVLNADDPRVDAAAPTSACRVVRFGAEGTGADVSYANVNDCALAGVRFDVTFGGGPQLPARSPLVGVHTLPAALAALAVAWAAGFGATEAVDALASAAIEGRMQVRPGLRGSTILDDRYNSSPASLAGALRTLASVGGESGGRRLALIGSMAELGPFEEEEHRTAGRVAAACCDLLYAVGEPCRALIEAAKAAGLRDAAWYGDKVAAAAEVARSLRQGDVVLVKASRSQAFETVVPLLLEGAA